MPETSQTSKVVPPDRARWLERVATLRVGRRYSSEELATMRSGLAPRTADDVPFSFGWKVRPKDAAEQTR